MAIDPKKGGKCWSCKHCEDIGFESEYDAVYMRKCCKSGYDYIDKCTNYCSSYVWDGKDPEFNYTPSSSSTSSSSSYSSSSGGGSVAGKVVGAIIVLAILSYAGYKTYLALNPPSAEGNEQTESVESVNTDKKTAVCNAKSALNMRSGPGEKYEKVGSIPRGETVIIEKEENGWAYVEYNGTKGWCAMNYLEIVK